MKLGCLERAKILQISCILRNRGDYWVKIIDGVRLPTVTDDSILGFFGEYRFLSNFQICDVRLSWNGYTFATSEHLYMAQKTFDESVWKALSENDSPVFARNVGQTFKLRDDWDEHRLVAMYDACYQKFSKNPDLREKLLLTGSKYLEETNNWGDKFWGVCDGFGFNNLGLILMDIRTQFWLEQ